MRGQLQHNVTCLVPLDLPAAHPLAHGLVSLQSARRFGPSFGWGDAPARSSRHGELKALRFIVSPTARQPAQPGGLFAFLFGPNRCPLTRGESLSLFQSRSSSRAGKDRHVLSIGPPGDAGELMMQES